MIDYEFLNQISLFQGMKPEDLELIANSVELVSIQKGEVLFHEGDQGSRAYFIKDGEVEIVREANGREVLLAVRVPGAVIGEMALLESLPRSATVRARADTQLYAINKQAFDKMLFSSPSAMHSLFQTMMSRHRSNQIALQQSEKMAQIGTLTAGVAHELNNPASAVRRSSDRLMEATRSLDAAYLHICRLGFDEHQWKILEQLSIKANQSAKQPVELDALVRSDQESLLEEWLDHHGVEQSWLIAPNLVNLNFSLDELSTLAAEFPAERLMCIIEWLDATFNVYSLLNEISVGAGRISSIVKALKSYTYLDQAPVQSVDICEGLDNTLMILHNKLKNKINVKKEFAPDLPEIMGYGSELNQVWTNILDNAIDALDRQVDAQIIIRTRVESGWVVVEIEDNGPGIPEDVLSKIFDAFYTTKAPGKGTGLGLNISYSIIVQKHHGDIKVSSEPGQTIFAVWLPVK